MENYRTEILNKIQAIAIGAMVDNVNYRQAMAIACALLTSPIKAEREEGKMMVRRWRMLGAR